VKLGNRNLADGVVVIAEIGNNHEGSIEVAERMVREAAASGADAVKFQTFQARFFVRASDTARYARMSKFELTPAQFTRLHDVARECGVLFISTPLDLPSVDTLRPLVDAFKIASGDNTFYPLLDAVCATGKPVIISSGATTLDELQSIYAYARRRCQGPLALLHCVSSYPAPPDQLGLSAIRTLAAQFDCPIGYSDHTLGIQACLTAVALGARIIEKHFTLDKNFSDFRDHQLSSDPAEFRHLVDGVRGVEASLGSGDKQVRACETDMVTAIRRSIVAAADLPAGHRLAAADLMWLRPAGGVPPGREAELIGRVLTQPLALGDMIRPDHLE
jgi:N,N'-diacetyllegionaminate synthase